ncbi:MAG: hypothetical protein ABIU54_09185 [Candidatus Eisenbacteria bacterium]
MTQHIRFRFAALALMCAMATLAGCSKKLTQADADYTQVEGTPSASVRLVGWPDSPTRVFTLDENGTPGTDNNQDADDFVIATEDRFVTGPGAIQTSLLDASLATGFQVFRREGNGGFRQLRDYVINPERKWRDSLITSTWELYTVDDPYPSGFTPASYVARGVVGGTSSQQSPLSNLVRITTAALADIRYSDTLEPNDSLFRMTWTPVDGAVGYWLHVFQYRPDVTTSERIRAGSPSPVFNGKVRDYLVAYVPAPANSYRLGAGTGAEVLMRQTTIFGQTYQVRVSAVNPEGQLIGFSHGDTAIVAGETTYQKYAKGSFDIQPKRPQR